MKNLFWSGVFFILLLSGCGTETPTRSNTFTPLTSIEISTTPNAAPTIARDTSIKLKAIGDFSGQFQDEITDQVVWTSDSPTVAAFSFPGSPNRVKGIAPGVATLTATRATAKGTVTASFQLTVSDASVTAMTISTISLSNSELPKGRTAQFSVQGTFSDSTTQDLTFDADWTSTDPARAAIGDKIIVDDNVNGKTEHFDKINVTAVELGPATITATFNGIPGTKQLTVTEPALDSITVTPSTTTILSLTSSPNFVATGHFSDGTTPDISSQVTWSSSLPAVATIPGAGGAAKGLTQGTTSISATLGAVTGAASLKVTGGNLTGIAISLTPDSLTTLVRDTRVRITATGTFGTGVTRDITDQVEWTTSALSAATVEQPGGKLAFVKALATTPAVTVTAKSGSLTATRNLAISAPTLLSIAISPLTLGLNTQTSDRLFATGTFNDNTTQDVTADATWASDAVTLATVGSSDTDLVNKGRVTGVAGGTATITASIGSVVSTNTPTVTVTPRTIQTLAITTAAVTSGNQVKFTATATYTDGSPNRDVTDLAVWSITPSNVAILADSTNQPGQVVGVDAGTATISATLGGKSDSETITVP